ncbi:hypothetical protein [Streptomyces sp. NPDC006640]|uniref:hypothetical protein n=1 Tax=unclassified Streptomyces TaxID=2593676 RepID=UPI0036C5E8E9
MSKHSHTANKTAAQELAAAESLTYAAARRIIERWATHPWPTDEELAAADAADFDPLFYYACQPPSEIPGFLMQVSEYPERSDGPTKYCYPHSVQSLAAPETSATLSLIARPTIYEGEPALVVQPVTYTPPPGARPGFGHWGNCWTIQLHDVGFLDRISNLAAPGWSATVTRGPEPSAPCALRLAHEDGYVLFDAETPLPPDWLARVRCHPEGVPVVCGPGAGREVPTSLDDTDYVRDLLCTLDLVAARVPFTVSGAAPWLLHADDSSNSVGA